MKEEELQELEEWYLDDEELHELQILKLIDIAKRFNDIQIENAKLSIMLRDTQSRLFDNEKQNKRYREELESLLKHAEELADKDILMSPTAVEKSIEKALEDGSNE